MWDFRSAIVHDLEKANFMVPFWADTMSFNAIGFKALGVHHTDQFHFFVDETVLKTTVQGWFPLVIMSAVLH